MNVFIYIYGLCIYALCPLPLPPFSWIDEKGVTYRGNISVSLYISVTHHILGHNYFYLSVTLDHQCIHVLLYFYLPLAWLNASVLQLANPITPTCLVCTIMCCLIHSYYFIIWLWPWFVVIIVLTLHITNRLVNISHQNVYASAVFINAQSCHSIDTCPHM